MFMEIVWEWLRSHADRILLLTIVVIAAAIITYLLGRGLRRILERSQIPSASIFINLTKLSIWLTAAAIVLQPVFGINPTTLVTALGIGGLAISLGLKDTIANVIGGFGLMLGKVIVPGDVVTISGTTGVVKDITWRQTVVQERSGNAMVIPNSVLNTSLLERITPASESIVQVPFTAKSGNDLNDIANRIVVTVERATTDLADPAAPPSVSFTGFSPYGVQGNIIMFAKPDVALGKLSDAAVRALASADFIEQRAAIGK
jgi:small-conductance mechanosensitive channel